MENVENVIIEKLTLKSHSSRLSEIFSTANHTSGLSEHLSTTEMLWTNSTTYMFWGEYFLFQ